MNVLWYGLHSTRYVSTLTLKEIQNEIINPADNGRGR